MGSVACSAERCGSGCESAPLTAGLASIGIELRRGDSSSSSSSPCRDSCHGFSMSNSTQLHVDGSSESSENEGEQVGCRGAVARRHSEFRCKPHHRAKQVSQGAAGDARIVQETLLHAARCGNFKQTVDAVDKGADVHGTTLRGQTALMLAAASHSAGTLEIIKFLLQAQADVNAKDELGWTPLLYACRNSQQHSAELLLDKAASLQARASDGKTAAMLAAIDGCDNLVMQLLEKRAEVDDADTAGLTVLAYACEEGHLALVRFLLKLHANPNKVAEDQTTPLMIAARNGDTKVGELLVRKHAGLNARNAEGDTALLVSLKARREPFALWIIGLGPNLTLKNEAGEDARALADSPDFPGVKHVLDMKLRGKDSGLAEAAAARQAEPLEDGL